MISEGLSQYRAVSVHWSCHVPGGPSSYHAKQGPHERTAGLYLCDAHDTQITYMRALLDAGADVNATDKVSGVIGVEQDVSDYIVLVLIGLRGSVSSFSMAGQR